MRPKRDESAFLRPNLMRLFALLSLWGLFFTCPGGIAQAPTEAFEGSRGGLTISGGDLLEIKVFDTPELSGRFRVGQSGQISLSQGGAINVGGMTAVQAEKAVEDRLRSQQIMLDPHVNVFVEEYASQGVIVLGEVSRPGTYTLLGDHTLYGALSAAGGATSNEGATITITNQRRPAEKQVIEVTSENFSEKQRSTPVNAGDTVFVAHADVIYVVGDVARPGAYNMPNGKRLNLLEVLALCSGLNQTAKASKSSIVRKTAEGAETIPVDLSHITEIAPANRYLYLEASDILVIPRSGVKTFLNVFIPNATTAVTSSIVTALVLR